VAIFIKNRIAAILITSLQSYPKYKHGIKYELLTKKQHIFVTNSN
jgi:hypothetical protein